MSKFNEALDKYISNSKDLGINVDNGLLEKVAKGLGPSIYNRDAETVSCSSEDELATVKNNFLIKKLGLSDSADLDAKMKEVCEEMGTSNRNKYRAIFYTLLVQKFGKESVYA